MEELISIIVPAYNNKEYIDKCIDSLKVQTYHNIEILLVDDGSTLEYADYYDRISGGGTGYYINPMEV